MSDLIPAALILLSALVLMVARAEYKCYKRRKERLEHGDTLEFM